MPSSKKHEETVWANADQSFMEFPSSVAESLAFGVPVVMTKGVGLSVKVSEFDMGLEAEFRPDSVAQAMIHLLSDSVLLERYSSNARRYAERLDLKRNFPLVISKTLDELRVKR
jgi:glycosyltransferase involved in cell wall biosynthesis